MSKQWQSLHYDTLPIDGCSCRNNKVEKHNNVNICLIKTLREKNVSPLKEFQNSTDNGFIFKFFR